MKRTVTPSREVEVIYIMEYIHNAQLALLVAAEYRST